MNATGKYASAWLLNILMFHAASHGVDTSVLLHAAGLEPADLRSAGSRIAIGRLCAAAEVVMAASGGALSGLALAEDAVLLYSQNNILMTIMANCATLGSAVEKLAAYHDIATDAVRLALRRAEDGEALLFRMDAAVPPPLNALLTEAALAACAAMLRKITRDKVRYTRICFAHSATGEPGGYIGYFGCPVVFEAGEDRIEFSAKAFELPIALPDTALLGVLERYAETALSQGGEEDSSIVQRVKCVLRDMLVSGSQFDVQAVSNKLNIGSRTLQKRLKREGTTYTRLLDAVRENLARRSLDDGGASLADTAFLLGFSEQSAFNHAFRRWTGFSPKEYIDRQDNRR